MRHRTLDDWMELATDAVMLLFMVAMVVALVIAIVAMVGVLATSW